MSGKEQKGPLQELVVPFDHLGSKTGNLRSETSKPVSHLDTHLAGFLDEAPLETIGGGLKDVFIAFIHGHQRGTGAPRMHGFLIYDDGAIVGIEMQAKKLGKSRGPVEIAEIAIYCA